MLTVIFACVHNAGRSQMAAALFNELADPTKAAALSAGTHPGERIHPEVVAVMREVGIDLSGLRPQKLTAALASQAQLLITMGCGDECRTCRVCAATTGRSRIHGENQSNVSARSAMTLAPGFKR
jgi:arsenate reductase (thioredoxin)